MISPHSFIQKALANTNSSEKDVNLIYLGYLLAMNKDILDLLISFKGNNSNFIEELNSFFDKHISSLTDDQKSEFESIINQRKEENITQVISLVANSLPEETKNKILTNLEDFS